MRRPLVSVCLITYNHVKYIKQCIDSVLSQVVDFDWEIIIADDFSTDGTRDVLIDYYNKYPTLIRLILQKKNVGPAKNFLDLINSPLGKYVSYIEGDDYWIDTHKLKVQASFMEQNYNFSMCFGRAKVITEYDSRSFNLNIYEEPPSDILDFDTIVQKHYIPSSTLFFRLEFMRVPRFYFDVLSGDILLEVLLAEKGPVKYFDKNFSVYRVHSNGVTQSISNTSLGQIKLYDLFVQLNKYFEFKHDAIFRKKIASIAKISLVKGSKRLSGVSKIRHIIRWFPRYYSSSSVSMKETIYLFMLLYCRNFLQSISILRKKPIV
jgi:glycosyltransferase involved in cell wall biosynthesis